MGIHSFTMPECDTCARTFAMRLKINEQGRDAGFLQHHGTPHHAPPVGANTMQQNDGAGSWPACHIPTSERRSGLRNDPYILGREFRRPVPDGCRRRCRCEMPDGDREDHRSDDAKSEYRGGQSPPELHPPAHSLAAAISATMASAAAFGSLAVAIGRPTTR